MFTRKPRLQLEKFAINGAKRLLQHNRHIPAVATAAKDGRSRLENGRWRSAARCLPERGRASPSFIRRSSGYSAVRRPLLWPQVRHASADARHGSCWV